MNRLMKSSFLLLATFLLGMGFAHGQSKKYIKTLEPGIYAAFNTSKGLIVAKLEVEKAPMTVANFVGLAEGKFQAYDKTFSKPFYDGLKFHRVIKDFMIQGGDPLGNGSGDPGYSFPDEFSADLKHSGPGILSMANSGPATNGSQFFITHKATPWLDGKHSVFGHVVLGQDIVNAIAQDDVMQKVVIIRKGDQYKTWNASEAFKKGVENQLKKEAEEKAKMASNLMKQPGIYATIKTSKGDIVLKLEADKTPMTVANFVGLAEGKFKAFDKTFDKPFYNGLKFHRVIKDFMIQGGDPQGNGSGGPGYKFPDETREDLKHNTAGILSMANSGPGTNGSQFFITHKETPWLDGKHTVFGHVISGQEVVNAIAQDDVMQEVIITRVGDKYKNWDANAEFQKVLDVQLLEEKKEQERVDKASKLTQEEYKVWLFNEIKKTYPNAQQSSTGLVYVIQNPGTGAAPAVGGKVSTHYIGTFTNGKKFDSSRDRGTPLDFTHKTGQMIAGYDEAVGLLKEGGRGIFVIPYYNAYGKDGRAPTIPKYADLMFDIELLKVNAPEVKKP